MLVSENQPSLVALPLLLDPGMSISVVPLDRTGSRTKTPSLF